MYEIKLSNKSENKVLQMFVEKYGNDLIILKGGDIPDVKWVKKNMKNQNVLILNAKNPELPKTELGNERTIEFCFVQNKKTIWIDVQHLLTPSSIVNVLLGKIYAAKKCKNTYFFPVDGKGYTDKQMLLYDLFMKDKYDNVYVFRLADLFNYI